MEHLGELEQLVMLAVVRLGPEAYGAAIQRELAQRARRRISIGTVYVTLTRLESKGLVSSWMGDPTPARGGKAKRYYAVERAGQAALRTAKDSLMRMWEGLAPSGASPSGSHVR
jgi:DNA-binding PadR family transcriptional regulator